MNSTIIIPVERGREWNQERATNLVTGTPYVVAEHDPGEYSSAIDKAVEVVETELIILSDFATWFDSDPPATKFLEDLVWDCDVTWGKMVMHKDDRPIGVMGDSFFCANRLRRENYIPPVMCMRKDMFQKVGGYGKWHWDLQNRLLDAGARFKYVPEALCARDRAMEAYPILPPEEDLLATFYHQATPGTTYWRCALPSRHLPGQMIFNHPYIGPNLDDYSKFPNHTGTAVFQFAGDAAHHKIIKSMKEKGIRVLLEVDDDYSHWYPIVMNRAGWKRDKTDALYSVEQHLETVREVDGIIVTTELLAKQYRKHNEHVFVCPNQIDPNDWVEPPAPTEKFRIGWFASASHQEDSALVSRALDWASRQPDVEVVMVGVGVTGERPWFDFPFLHRPWSNDFGVYRRFIGELDVGLCPVVGNPWAQCRSDLKALEYSMAGAVSFVSDQPPYHGLEIPGITHCKNAKDFLRAVQHAVANRDETRELAVQAREYVLENRTVEKNIADWKTAVVG